jgi:VIT1/CCC1 family predicted Fe2+/Mn2+ transporter
MGFHDGVVSITAMLLTLLSHGGTPNTLLPGIAATFAGAVSMSLGEYSSVSTARDNGLEYEDPTRAAVSSFASFVLGATLPLLIVWSGGPSQEANLLVAAGIITLVSAMASRSNIPRTLTITTVALGASYAFGRLL